MGMIKKAVVLCAVIAAVPLPAEERAREEAANGPGTFAYLSAASETYSDLKDFCQRQPAVCSTADFVTQTMAAKARYAARVIYEWTSGNKEHGKGNEVKQAKSTLVNVEADKTFGALPALSDGSAKTINDLMPELRGSIYEDEG